MCAVDGPTFGLHRLDCPHPCLGDEWPSAALFGHLAADREHRDDGAHLPCGVSHPEQPDRDGEAMQATLDEILRALDTARVAFDGLKPLTAPDRTSAV